MKKNNMTDMTERQKIEAVTTPLAEISGDAEQPQQETEDEVKKAKEDVPTTPRKNPRKKARSSDVPPKIVCQRSGLVAKELRT